MRTRRLVIAAGVLLSLGCGGDTATTPPAPPPAPAPVPPPPEPPPAPPSDPVRPEPTAECAAVLEAVEGSELSLLAEWWHTPFTVNYYDNFPVDVVGPDYLPGQFEVVQKLADQIEGQLGYPVIEFGGLVTPPEGWTAERAVDSSECQDWREPGEIAVYHLPEAPEGQQGGGPVGSVGFCVNIYYWVGDGRLEDPNEVGFADTVVIQRLFFLLGFDYPESESHSVPSSLALDSPWEAGLSEYTATEEDIAALGCLFPEPPE